MRKKRQQKEEDRQSKRPRFSSAESDLSKYQNKDNRNDATPNEFCHNNDNMMPPPKRDRDSSIKSNSNERHLIPKITPNSSVCNKIEFGNSQDSCSSISASCVDSSKHNVVNKGSSKTVSKLFNVTSQKNTAIKRPLTVVNRKKRESYVKSSAEIHELTVEHS